MNYECYEWFKKWFKLIINDNEQKCIICGENKDLTSRIETSICSDVINTYLYKDSRNLKSNMCLDCYKELEGNLYLWTTIASESANLEQQYAEKS